MPFPTLGVDEKSERFKRRSVTFEIGDKFYISFVTDCECGETVDLERNQIVECDVCGQKYDQDGTEAS